MPFPDLSAADRPAMSGEPAVAAAPARRLRAWLIPAAAGLVFVIGVVIWLVSRPPAVETEIVHTGPAIESVYASGVVDFVRQARVASVVNAPIRAVRVNEGDDVRAGDVL